MNRSDTQSHAHILSSQFHACHMSKQEPMAWATVPMHAFGSFSSNILTGLYGDINHVTIAWHCDLPICSSSIDCDPLGMRVVFDCDLSDSHMLRCCCTRLVGMHAVTTNTTTHDLIEIVHGSRTHCLACMACALQSSQPPPTIDVRLQHTRQSNGVRRCCNKTRALHAFCTNVAPMKRNVVV